MADEESHWRVLLIERLQKIESSVESHRSDLAEVKTSAAVYANEAKSRSDMVSSVQSDVKDLTKFMRDLERALQEPKGQAEIEKRVKTLEEWQANLMGRLSVVGFFVAIGASIFTTFLAKAFGLAT